jgi:hypothetical protein
MSAVLDYINTHNLPLITWLNADAANINTSNNTFTWVNKKPDTDYDFIQSNPAAYPVATTSGVSFGVGQSLKSRLPVSYTDKSYTVLHISTNTATTTASLVSYLRADLDSPEIDYTVTGTAVRQVYTPSLLKTSIEVGSLDSNSNTVRLGMSHNVKQGKSSLILPGVLGSSIINIDTSHKGPSGLIQIGGDTSIENLYHLLIFNRKLTSSHIHQLLDLLLYSTPALSGFVYWDLITNEVWELMNEATWDNLL